MRRLHTESHLVERIGWLRAAVLGANDGIISTASLILGVASAAASKSDVLLSGVAGLVAGAMSMAAGEYVSVSSQSDTERADLEREKRELSEDPEFEKEELAQIYAARGVELGLARKVAQQLMAKDALGAHARDELGISEISTARPVQAALASAATFSRRSGGAPRSHPPLAFGVATPHRFDGLVGLPSFTRHDRRKDRRRRDPSSNYKGRILGRSRDGFDRGDRCLSGQGSVVTAWRDPK